MSKKCWCLAAVTAIVLLWMAPGSASFAGGPSYNDLWDVSQGAQVTASSPIHSGCFAKEMFGDASGYVEPGIALFSDDYTSGTWHYVRWTTPTDVTVGSFSLYADHDPDWNGYGRSFNRFELLAKRAGGWETIFATDVCVPYVHQDASSKLLISHVLSEPVTAREFEARFRQHTDVPYAKGPRVIELDGLAVVPEPGALSALACGLSGIFCLARKRR